MKRIDTFEELEEYALKVLAGQEELDKLRLGKEFKHHLIIKGKEWGGYVNENVAKIILAYQNSLKRVYILSQGLKISPNLLNNEILKELEFRATIHEGSLGILSNIPDVLEKIINKMTNKQIFYLMVLAVFCYTGYKFFSSYLEHLEKGQNIDFALQMYNLNMQNISEINKIISKYRKIVEEAEKPNRLIFNKMQKGDILIIKNKNEKYSYEDLKQIVPKPEKTKPKEVIIDDEYIIHEFKNYEGIGKKIVLTKGNISFPALVVVPEDSLIEIFKHINTLIPIKLNVLATIRKNKIEQAIVTGIGEKRQNSVPVEEILKP